MVRKTLKNEIKPWLRKLRKQWWGRCEFIARIEDICENYDQKKPYALMKDPSSGRFYSTNSSEKKDFPERQDYQAERSMLSLLSERRAL